MKKNILFLLIAVVSSYSLSAQIYCPDDKVVSCLSSLTTEECGMATVVSGNYHPSMIKFIDQNETNSCNEGNVYRKFYLDLDYSNTHSDNEPSCTQTITLVYSNLPLNIQFPSDMEYSCVDEIPVESPTWSIHPCDLVGYTYEDEVFEFDGGACLKIVRTYSVINWCIYDVNSGEGLYNGIQIIKIVDKMAPEIDNCEDQYFDAGENCETLVTLTNSATDFGDCPSGTLTWRVSVDLWGNGTEDLFYGPNESPPFRLDPVENGATIEIAIPEAVGVARHKVDWRVTDGCGNVITCSSEFFVEDNKPPTPYCINFTGASLNGENGGQLVIPVSFFSLDAIDNCSSKENIILSFSENVEDTERIIECGDAGFQFFRIYYTDEAGNQDFCEVFMIIFDNGTCFMKYAPGGMITKPDGSPIEGATAYLMEENEVIALKQSDQNGFFSFGEQDLMEAYSAIIKSENETENEVDIEDFIIMRSALLGLEQLDFYQKVAADIDQNNSFNIDDLYQFRNVLLGKSEIPLKDLWTFIPQMLNISATQNNLEISESIPYNAYGEGFDFFGVKTGDLTGSRMIQIDEIAEKSEVLAFTLEITNDELIIISNQDFKSDAYQFDVAISNPGIQIKSEFASVKETNAGLRYLNINPAENIPEDQVLFRINTSVGDNISIDDVIIASKIFEHGAFNSSSVDWTIIDNRDFSSENVERVELNVYPLPMQNRLKIDALDISSVELYGLTGERIDTKTFIDSKGASITCNGELGRGIYFLRVITKDDERIVKVVK